MNTQYLVAAKPFAYPSHPHRNHPMAFGQRGESYFLGVFCKNFSAEDGSRSDSHSKPKRIF
jgi:hypothetical protein